MVWVTKNRALLIGASQSAWISLMMLLLSTTTLERCALARRAQVAYPGHGGDSLLGEWNKDNPGIARSIVKGEIDVEERRLR